MQTIGIDGSKDTLHVALAVNEDARNDKVLASHKFSNNETGFKSFVDWMKKKKADAGTVCLMEATGVYHEPECGQDCLYGEARKRLFSMKQTSTANEGQHRAPRSYDLHLFLPRYPAE